jgi:steroid-24-oyl-CoA synthetase
MSTIVNELQTSFNALTQTGAPFEIIERSHDQIPHRIYKNAPSTMRELLNVARNHGDAIFLDYEGDQWSFNRFFAQADAIAHALVHQHHVQTGDRIAIAMRNYPEWMTSFTAIAGLGCVVVPLNSWGGKEELKYGLNDCAARTVFCDQQRYELIADSLSELGVNVVVARATGHIEQENAQPLQDFLADVPTAETDRTIPSFDVSSEDSAMILYTSGTTGKPKGAVSSHRNITQAIYNFEYSATNAAMCNAKTMEAMMSCGHAPSSLLGVPLFHVSGCYAMFLLSLRGGRKIVMMYKWDPTDALKLIEKHRITTLSAVPNMVMDVLEHPKFEQTDTSSLFALGSGGSATPPRFTQLAYKKIDNVYPGTGYGLTETNAICASGSGESYRYKPYSAGPLSPIVDFKTCDKHNQELPQGTTGEIWIRSPTVAQGYWNKPEASAESFIDGWFKTGDIGYLDSENFVVLVDRAKDIIIRGGENISAAEVEGCIYDHPAVWEVAAFSVPNDTLGEEVAVAITFKHGQSATKEDIKQFVGQRLAGFKVPSIISLVDAPLPRNPSGKVLKHVIRENYLAH